ncbi:MarR family winged helix-turn-helix transcriptional regulator [Nonomuraea lactucae]|uniref:MarR family winged helix-turn-helix transcriptional regulator n=1 Tax=Nonomuraea lactucae TaxID=2249762 RepID=UPI000DE24CCB|nr:MarR family transcriptional regulator [Nonomuraea lactucae]
MGDESLIGEHRSSPGLMLALLGGEAMRRLRDAHTAHGLNPRQFELLGLLYDRGPLGQGELGHLMDVAASILVTQLNPLEAEGLIVRSRHQVDRRRHVVALTDAGLARLRQASQAQHDVEDVLFAKLSADQREQLRQVLTLVRDHLINGDEHCATPASPDEQHHLASRTAIRRQSDRRVR